MTGNVRDIGVTYLSSLLWLTLHDYSQTLFCLKRAELLFLLSNFSLFGWERDFFMWWCWWNFVLCDLLHFEWRMITSYKSSLAASCHRIKTSTTATDRTIFQSCRNTTKRNRETTRPTWENYYSYIMNAPTSRILDLWTVERLHQICQR